MAPNFKLHPSGDILFNVELCSSPSCSQKEREYNILTCRKWLQNGAYLALLRILGSFNVSIWRTMIRKYGLKDPLLSLVKSLYGVLIRIL